MTILSTQIIKVGNDIVVNLPDEVLQDLNIKEGQYVSISLEDNKLVLEVVNKKNTDEKDILELADEVSSHYDKALKQLSFNT